MSGDRGPLSYNATLVLQAVSQGYRYGFDIMRVTGLPSGTVYPLLRRLDGAGLMASDWEDEETATREGRPPRRYYAVEPEGARALAEALERIAAQRSLLAGEVEREGEG